MGLLDKVKNLFTEEVEEPNVKREEQKKHEVKREIQKQEKKIEIAPARRETKALLGEEKMEEISVLKEEKPVLPIYFSDEDFEDLEKPKKAQDERVVKEAYKGRKEIKEERKNFRPSPIISPVYGILDKNYKKDDITTKDIPSIMYRSDKITVDDIRNKAYGTLEDELENNLLDDPIIIDNKDIDDVGIDIFEELETRESRNNKRDLLREDLEITKDVDETDLSVELEKQKQKIEEINEIIKNNISQDKNPVASKKIDNILEELDEIEELIPDNKEDNNEEDVLTGEKLETKDENLDIKEENENTKDDLEESDLFNLIDSMYEKRDE